MSDVLNDMNFLLFTLVSKQPQYADIFFSLCCSWKGFEYQCAGSILGEIKAFEMRPSYEFDITCF